MSKKLLPEGAESVLKVRNGQFVTAPIFTMAIVALSLMVVSLILNAVFYIFPTSLLGLYDAAPDVVAYVPNPGNLVLERLPFLINLCLFAAVGILLLVGYQRPFWTKPLAVTFTAVTFGFLIPLLPSLFYALFDGLLESGGAIGVAYHQLMRQVLQWADIPANIANLMLFGCVAAMTAHTIHKESF